MISGMLFGTSLYVGNQQGDYTTLQAAVNACSGTGVFDIYLRPAANPPLILYENVIIENKVCDINIYGGLESQLTISIANNYIINGSNIEPVFRIINNNSISINGLSITNGLGNSTNLLAGQPNYPITGVSKRGGGIYAFGDTQKLTVNKCKIYNNVAYRGAGLFLRGSKTDILDTEINNNIIDDCIELNSEFSSEYTGSAIYISKGRVDIKRCNIHHNTTIADDGTGSVIAHERYDHTTQGLSGSLSDYIYFDFWYDINIIDTCIYHNTGRGGGFIISLYESRASILYALNWFKCTNSTIVNNVCSGTNVEPDYLSGIIYKVEVGGNPDDLWHGQITNMIIRDNTHPATDIHQFRLAKQISTVVFDFLRPDSLFYNDIHWLGPENLDPSNIDADPIFMSPANENYRLKWTSNVYSPFIDSGDISFEHDPDGTRADMGCYPYEQQSKEYEFVNSPEKNIFWMSFPVVDTREYEVDNYYNQIGKMFEENMDIQPNTRLNTIDWNYGGVPGTCEFQDPIWTNNIYIITPQKGFKVKFQDEPIPIHEDGIKFNPGLDAVQMAYRDSSYNILENWIGYYVPYTQSLKDAFSKTVPGTRYRYIDFIYSIQAQTWATQRTASNWECDWILEPSNYTLSEGDMVVVEYCDGTPEHLQPPEDLYWNYESNSKDPYQRQQPQYFTYEEKLDYQPVYIEFDPDDLPDEVGIMVNGVCKGAAVVDSSLIEVNYYPEFGKEGDVELEIAFWYAGKGAKQATGWTLYNRDKLIFEKAKLYQSQIGDYAYISFKTGAGESPFPVPTKLEHNYPNPFNPETKLVFTLSKQMPVEMSIYNIKGQKVKTLLRESLPKGRHSVVWDGRDSNRKPVASGIYFCRFHTPVKQETRKMMLTK